MTKRTFKTLVLALLVFVTRPLYGQVYPSGTYTPSTNAVTFFDNTGTPTIGSTQLAYDPTSPLFTFGCAVTFGYPASFTSSATFSSGINLSGGNFSSSSGNISLSTGTLTLSSGDLTLTSGGLTLGSGDFNVGTGTVYLGTSSTLNVESGTFILGATSLTNSSGNLMWGSNFVVAASTAPAAYQTLYYNGTNWVPSSTLYNDGTNIGIGTSSISSGLYKLSVEGKVRAREVEVNPDMWSDFVFDKNYKLTRLDSLEQEVNTLKHLPGIPAADEVAKKGVAIGQMDALLLQKIEELTLYIIQQQKEIDALKATHNNVSH